MQSPGSGAPLSYRWPIVRAMLEVGSSPVPIASLPGGDRADGQLAQLGAQRVLEAHTPRHSARPPPGGRREHMASTAPLQSRVPHSLAARVVGNCQLYTLHLQQVARSARARVRRSCGTPYGCNCSDVPAMVAYPPAISNAARCGLGATYLRLTPSSRSATTLGRRSPTIGTAPAAARARHDRRHQLDSLRLPTPVSTTGRRLARAQLRDERHQSARASARFHHGGPSSGSGPAAQRWPSVRLRDSNAPR